MADKSMWTTPPPDRGSEVPDAKIFSSENAETVEFEFMSDILDETLNSDPDVAMQARIYRDIVAPAASVAAREARVIGPDPNGLTKLFVVAFPGLMGTAVATAHFNHMYLGQAHMCPESARNYIRETAVNTFQSMYDKVMEDLTEKAKEESNS